MAKKQSQKKRPQKQKMEWRRVFVAGLAVVMALLLLLPMISMIAGGVGAPKSVNVVLLGALATRLDFSQEAWERVVARRVPPKTVDANLAAFRAGLAFAREAAGGEGA